MEQEWISVKDKLPEFDVNVLIYWQLERDKKEDGYYDMIEIASVRSITKGKDYQNAEWTDSDYNQKQPTHWMPLPAPPTTENKSTTQLEDCEKAVRNLADKEDKLEFPN